MSDTQTNPTPPDNDITTLQAQLAAAQQELAATRAQLDATERRQRIDGLLVDADAIDLEAARLLTEAAVQIMDEPDVKVAVEELRRRKPYLFRRRPRSDGSMAARPRRDMQHADDAAEQAAMTGDRRDLLRYLRLRRR